MASVKMPVEGPSIGFDFSNYARNQFLGERMNGLPRGELAEAVSIQAQS
jgi:20S proteasome subunit beta 2